MQVFHISLFRAIFVLFLAGGFLGLAQTAPPREPPALRILQQSVALMGGSVPSSSKALGSVEIVEGSATDTGRVRILTRGLEETREEFRAIQGLRGRVYAHGLAAELSGTTRKATSLELAATSQCPSFPLVLIATVLNNPDYALQYLGQETLGGARVHHIRFWNTFASQPQLVHLAEFSVRDIWIDASSALPLRLSYDERDGGGDAPSIAVGAIYSDYRNAGGVLYPFLIERIYNGTPWATIRVENVILNEALSDEEFELE